MASSVYYKFKAQRDESKISFDGTGISVFDLKKEIILSNNLKDNRDVDLLLYDPSSNQEYKDDSHIIPRSSSVIARRVPASRPGKGKIPMYVAGVGVPATSGAPSSNNSNSMSSSVGRGTMSMRFDKKEDMSVKPQESTPTMPSSSTETDEDAAMAAMFRASNENWQETQEKMAHSVPVYSNRGGRGGKPFSSRTPYQQNDRPLPPSYVCYRCGKKGHWIQDCPTNSDREYDHRPRIKRTTGIPRSFLKAVDTPSEGGPSHGIMITPEGGFVVAQPDAASWQKQVSRSKGISAVDVRERPPRDPALVCPIDKKLFKDAVKTPCCGTSYCEECINSHLLENDFICPNCSKKIHSLDKLVMDKPMRTRVGDYIDKVIKEINEAEEEAAKEEVGGEDEGDRDDGEFTFDQQPGNENPTFDINVLLNETIPQLQAQIQQLSVMLTNPNLPPHARQTTEVHYQELQMQLNQAQAFAALASDMTAAVQQNLMQFNEDMQAQQNQHSVHIQVQSANPNAGQGQWMGGGNVGDGNMFSNQQPAGPDSAYQRLPVNGRRRAIKRERPSDFLEIGGGDAPTKMPRFWE